MIWLAGRRLRHDAQCRRPYGPPVRRPWGRLRRLAYKGILPMKPWRHTLAVRSRDAGAWKRAAQARKRTRGAAL